MAYEKQMPALLAEPQRLRSQKIIFWSWRAQSAVAIVLRPRLEPGAPATPRRVFPVVTACEEALRLRLLWRFGVWGEHPNREAARRADLVPGQDPFAGVF
ncbi:hypothetical protein [Streptomyces sp. NPDC058629]|uniref:hypothetical protein n=1 Tax=Streptomyces sp. NPDC058629 TaxID=3346565 RepID=UPI0036546529